jgi:hypothetical protein
MKNGRKNATEMHKKAELSLRVRDVIRDAGWSLGRSNAPRGSFRSKCQVKALLHGKIDEVVNGDKNIAKMQNIY